MFLVILAEQAKATNSGRLFTIIRLY